MRLYEGRSPKRLNKTNRCAALPGLLHLLLNVCVCVCVWRWGKRESITYPYTVTTRMTCIKMGSDDSHFNVSLVGGTKSQDRVHKPQPF